MIDIHLTTIRKYRSKNEWRPVNSASCILPDGTCLEQTGDHAILVAICAEIEGLGHSDMVRVLRDGKVAILPFYVGLWASKKKVTEVVDKPGASAYLAHPDKMENTHAEI